MAVADRAAAFHATALPHLPAPAGTAPDAIRGRVNAVSQVFVSGSNELGDFRAGVSAGLLGTVPAVMVGAFGTIAVAALWSWMFPSLRKLDRLSDLPGNAPAKSDGGPAGR